MPFLKRIPLAAVLGIILLLFPVIGGVTWSLKLQWRKEWLRQKDHENQVAVQKIRSDLAAKPNDRETLLKLASTLYAQGAYDELPVLLAKAADDPNWTPETEGKVIYSYSNDQRAVLAFLEARRLHEPTVSQLSYLIAGCECQLGLKEAALEDLKKAISQGGAQAKVAAKADPRFTDLATDPAFKALVHTP